MFQSAGPSVISPLAALIVPLLPHCSASSFINNISVVIGYRQTKSKWSVSEWISFFIVPHISVYSAHRHFPVSFINVITSKSTSPSSPRLPFSFSSCRPILLLLLLLLAFILSLLRAAAPASHQHQCLGSAWRVRARGLCYTSIRIRVYVYLIPPSSNTLCFWVYII